MPRVWDELEGVYWEEEIVEAVTAAAEDLDAAQPLLQEAGQDVVLNFSALGRACAAAAQDARDTLHALEPTTAACLRLAVLLAFAAVCYYAFHVVRAGRRRSRAFTRDKRT